MSKSLMPLILLGVGGYVFMKARETAAAAAAAAIPPAPPKATDMGPVSGFGDDFLAPYRAQTLTATAGCLLDGLGMEPPGIPQYRMVPQNDFLALQGTLYGSSGFGDLGFSLKKAVSKVGQAVRNVAPSKASVMKVAKPVEAVAKLAVKVEKNILFSGAIPILKKVSSLVHPTRKTSVPAPVTTPTSAGATTGTYKGWAWTSDGTQWSATPTPSSGYTSGVLVDTSQTGLFSQIDALFAQYVASLQAACPSPSTFDTTALTCAPPPAGTNNGYPANVPGAIPMTGPCGAGYGPIINDSGSWCVPGAPALPPQTTLPIAPSSGGTSPYSPTDYTNAGGGGSDYGGGSAPMPGSASATSPSATGLPTSTPVPGTDPAAPTAPASKLPLLIGAGAAAAALYFGMK